MCAHVFPADVHSWFFFMLFFHDNLRFIFIVMFRYILLFAFSNAVRERDSCDRKKLCMLLKPYGNEQSHLNFLLHFARLSRTCYRHAVCIGREGLGWAYGLCFELWVSEPRLCLQDEGDG